MTTSKPINPLGAQSPSPTGKLEQDASLVAVEAAGALGAVKVAGVVLVGLLVCPPLAVIAFVIVAPFVVVALALGLVAAVVSIPYLLVHHFRGHHGGHLSLLEHRLRQAGRALVDLAPHRIVADVRNAHSGR